MSKQFAAKTPDDLPSAETLLAMSGLEFIEAIFNGEVSGPPIAELMNFKLHHVENGKVTFRGAPQFSHFNPMGGTHGGWYGTILDSALGCAVATTLPKGSTYTTLEYKVNLTRAIKAGQWVDCTAHVQHSGRSTAVAEAVITGVEDGKIYATGSTTCIILRPSIPTI
ncbi:PaaI family thioesterase [Pararhodobacter oceanensis]|uniref:PaaI family thioesterase n=1 Tax=Pararhodobacter oceanensis TaxID=2172121 RepID=UPI003A94DA82